MAPATGPPTNADMTCCAASVRPFAASRRERGTRSGTIAEPARSTNTSVTPYSSTITVSAVIVICPDGDQPDRDAEQQRPGGEPDHLGVLAVAPVDDHPGGEPAHQPGEPGRGGEQRDLAGGAGERQGVQRDAGLHDPVAEVGHPGRGQVRREPAAEGFARGDLLAHGYSR